MYSEFLPWVLFNLFIVALLLFDLALHRKAHVISIKEASFWSLFWIGLAMLFNGYIYLERGQEAALAFLTGYLIEKSLSVDNIFVFVLIFDYFKTPKNYIHKVLFWGVFGAIVMRALFIWLGIALLTQFHAVIYLFGVFLIITGVKFALEKDKEIEPEKNGVLILFRKIFSVTPDYEGDRFFVRKMGKFFATPLFVVLLVVETTDLIFAVDSIPAILSITYDPFIVFTSNIFAIMGLRSLYFLLANFMKLFHYLHYGLALILVFIGVKMLLVDLYPISTEVALLFVFGSLFFFTALSFAFPLSGNNSTNSNSHE